MDIPGTRNLSKVRASGSIKTSENGRSTIFSTVFHQPWWLEAVTGGNWQEATVSSNGAVIARLPYVNKRLLGVPAIGMPPLTHLLGPQLPVDNGGGDARPSSRRALWTELMAQLPPHKYFSQVCDPGITDALALYALGYDSALKYTLRIPRMASTDEILAGMRPRIRSAVRKAEQMLVVDFDLDIEEFCRFFNVCTQENNGQWWSPRYAKKANAVKIRLYEACIKAGAGCLLAARDSAGVLRAAIMLVWDDGVMYYFLTAHDDQPEGAGSVKLLIWEGLKLAQRYGMIFDFHGLPRPNAINILTGFGGTVANRIMVTKIPPALYLARDIASRIRFGL